jgi:hypothetical protein
MKNLIILFKVLKQGEMLRHAATWKSVQILAPIFATLIIIALSFTTGLNLTAEDIAVIAKSLAILGVTINAYLTVATTPKLGLPTNPELSKPDDLSGQNLDVPTESSLDGGSKILGGH